MSRRTVHAAFAVLLAGVAVFALTGEIWVRNATSVGGIVLMALHAVRRPDARVVLLALLDTGDERVTRLAVDAGRRVGFDVTALLGDAGLPIVATLSDASSAARGPAGAFAAPAGSARSASPDR